MAIVDGRIRCCDCAQPKPLDAFSPSIASKGSGRCRECARNAQRAARARDPVRFKEYRKAFVARNPEAARASQRRWENKKRAAYDEEPPARGSISCSMCRERLPLAMFQPSVVARGSGVCRKCKQVAKRDYERRNRDKTNAAQRARHARRGEEFRATRREHYRANPEAYRSYNLGRYGITPTEYDARLAAQGGVCACCGATANRNGKRLFVDHDHRTGAIRGILCHRCNAGIGHLGDTVDGVRRALAYLERSERAAAGGVPPRRSSVAR